MCQVLFFSPLTQNASAFLWTLSPAAATLPLSAACYPFFPLFMFTHPLLHSSSFSLTSHFRETFGIVILKSSNRTTELIRIPNGSTQNTHLLSHLISLNPSKNDTKKAIVNYGDTNGPSLYSWCSSWVLFMLSTDGNIFFTRLFWSIKMIPL